MKREIINSTLLFVYGTLMSGYENRYARLLRESSTFVGTAWSRGELKRVSWYPGMIRRVTTMQKVYGELYIINDLRILKELDNYEEASKFNIKKYEFRRMKISVRIADCWVSSWAYIYTY